MAGLEVPFQRSVSRYVIWNRSKCQPASEIAFRTLLLRLAQAGFGDIGCIHGLDLREADGRMPSDLEPLLVEAGVGMLCEATHVLMPEATLAEGNPLNRSPDSLDLSVRSSNCLSNAKIFTIAELLRWTPVMLLKIPSMGKKSLAEIEERLASIGLCLPEKAPEPTTTVPATSRQFNIHTLLDLKQAGFPNFLADPLARIGIRCIADLVQRSPQWVRGFGHRSPIWIRELQSRLADLGLHLSLDLPKWHKAHREELVEAFSREIEAVIPHEGPPVQSASVPIQQATPSTCLEEESDISLEEELERFFTARANQYKKRIVRRRFGWSGDSPATLEQLGAEFGLSRERIRQIESHSVRDSAAIRDLNCAVLRRALALISEHEPCLAQAAEEALRDQQLVRGPFRIEGVLTAAELAGLPFSMQVENWNDIRFVVRESSARIIGRWSAQVRKQVSHFGVARKSLVRAELEEKISDELVILACLAMENVRWLDADHEWMWVPTPRNPILNRLARILRVAPKLRIAEAFQGVFRDGRMDGNTCPEPIFATLCSSIPWCTVCEGQVVGLAGIPEQEADSTEDILVGIFKEHGPAISRGDLWVRASSRGIAEVNFGRLLQNSNVIIRVGPQTYALIGSAVSMQNPCGRQEPIEHYVTTLAEDAGIEILQGCDPASLDFPFQVLQRIFERSSASRAQGSWSMAELGWTGRDRAKLFKWGESGNAEFRELSAKRISLQGAAFDGMDALGIAFLAFCSETARLNAAEGDMWPHVHDSVGALLRSKLFAAPGIPKPRLREATEDVCRKLRVRHVFGREGEQSWLRTVFLQFGMTRSGYKRLPFWLCQSSIPPVAIQDLLETKSALYSSTFSELWQTLQRYRWGSLEEIEAEASLARSPWVAFEDHKSILEAATARRDIQPNPDGTEGFEDHAADTVLTDPRLRWTGAAPVFEILLEPKPPKWLAEQRYVLTIGNKRIPVVKDTDQWMLDTPDGILQIELHQTSLEADLRHRGVSVLGEPLIVQLAPESDLFALYDLATGRKIDLWKSKMDRRRAFALLCRSQVTVLPEAPHFSRVFGDEWILWAFRQGLPANLEVRHEDLLLWSPSWSDEGGVISDGQENRLAVHAFGGWWGEKVEVSVAALPDTEPRRVIIGSQRIELSCTQSGIFRGNLQLLAGADYSSPAQIEWVRGGRLERRTGHLHLGEICGVAIETEAGWKALDSSADIDIEYFRARRLLVRLASKWQGEPKNAEDWVFLEGHHFSDRPRRNVASLGNLLNGVGEPLELSVGPYNNPDAGKKLARGLLHSGVIRWIDFRSGRWEIQFRTSLDFGPEHQLWVWLLGEDSPMPLNSEAWRQVDGVCEIEETFVKPPAAFAISYRGTWLGARTCSGLGIFKEILEGARDWPIVAKWLRWWRAPLLHEYLKPVVKDRAEADPVNTLSAWLMSSPPGHGAKYSELHEEAWLSVVRASLWAWHPTAEQAGRSLLELGMMTGDPAIDVQSCWDRLDPLLATNPMLLAQLSSLGVAEIYKEATHQEQDIFLRMLKNRILGLDRVSKTGEFGAAFDQCRAHAAESMSVDERFVTDSLLRDAFRLMSGEQIRDRNLQIALANPPIRKFLAVSLLEHFTGKRALGASK